MLFPNIIPNVIKNDVAFLMISGFWAMIPDLNKLMKFPHGEKWQNIFWFHTSLDAYPDLPKYGFYALLIMIIILAVYYKRFLMK